MRQDIQNKLGIKAYDIYGLTELSGPGVAYECSDQHGMHICEDHFIAEIIDLTWRGSSRWLQGELVFTSITKEAFPLIRYRTRDICVLDRSPCPCGRTHVRMSKPMGRSDDMMIIRGVNVFPSQIEEVLLKVSGRKPSPPNYRSIVGRENNTRHPGHQRGDEREDVLRRYPFRGEAGEGNRLQTALHAGHRC